MELRSVDFSNDIGGLVDALTDSTQNEGIVHIGKLGRFDVFSYHLNVLLTHPELDAVDARELSRYLIDNGWKQSANLGAMGSPYPIRNQVPDVPYIDVDRITQRKEKLSREMSELSGLLENYRRVVVSE